MSLRYINTPCGSFEVPPEVARRLDRMSDIALLEAYVQNCKQFVDPFLFQEMVSRGLVFEGDTYRDIDELLYREKTGR